MVHGVVQCITEVVNLGGTNLSWRQEIIWPHFYMSTGVGIYTIYVGRNFQVFTVDCQEHSSTCAYHKAIFLCTMYVKKLCKSVKTGPLIIFI